MWTFEHAETTSATPRPSCGLVTRTRLPLARLTFRHQIEPTETGSRFVHRVTISGPLHRLFARVIGKQVAAGLPVAMQALARLAETPPLPRG